MWLMPISIRKLHTKYNPNRTQDKLLTWHYGCHGNLVTIEMRYVADVYYPKQRRQGSYKVDAAIANYVAIANY